MTPAEIIQISQPYIEQEIVEIQINQQIFEGLDGSKNYNRKIRGHIAKKIWHIYWLTA